MRKITGLEAVCDVPSKVLLMYKAVEQLMVEGVDMNDIRVSTITDRAGIGKGTAYDYFDTKDDILACAIIFYMRKAMEELNGVLLSQGGFAEQVDFLLKEIAKGNEKHQCLMRYIHMMTDTSKLSRLVQEKMHMKELNKYLPAGLFTAMLETGMERGEVRKDLPVEYMVYVLFSRILSYMICFGEDCLIGVEPKQIRPFVYQSILDELCEKNV